MTTTFGSVCSGIEAASVAFAPLGWRAAWLSEIDPFACAVLAHHYPEVPNLGDMTTLPARIAAGDVEAPEVFCGGTPCQAFSVAGNRESLADDRGNLTLTFCDIADAIDASRHRGGYPPAAILWENVPGVLSTKDNAFGCFLARIAGEDEPLRAPGGRWSNAGAVYGPARAVAWRTLDAQFFGLAQRRRRVFVVASARPGFDPAAVLFEFDGVRRDHPPRRGEGQDVAPTVAGGARRRGGYSTDDIPTVAATLDASFGRLQGCSGQDANHGHSHSVAFGGNNTSGPIAAAAALNAHGGSGRMDFESETFVTAFSCKDYGADAGAVSPTLRSMGHDGSHANGGGQAAIAFQSSQSGVRVGDVHATLDSNNGSRRHNGAITGMQVRRLTPEECETLQGFERGYTLIPWRGRPADECPDGPRYKALGNSWAVPCVAWIGRRIEAELWMSRLGC